jgi:hypothetical protein
LRPFSVTLPTGKIVNITSLQDWGSWEKWKVNINDLEQLTRLDFFSNVDKNIQEIIEGHDTPPTLSARLMAGSLNGYSNNLSWEDHIGVDVSSGVYAFPNTITQVGIGEINTSQVTIIESGSLHK